MKATPAKRATRSVFDAQLERTRLDARNILLALRALRCEYAPDTSVSDGRWVGRCPACRAGGALVVAETRQREPTDTADPLVSVGCSRRCAEPAVIAAILATDPALLEARADGRRWRGIALRAIDRHRRSLALELDEPVLLRIAA